MKVSQDLLLGIAIGAGAALLLSRASSPTGNVIITPKLPSPKAPGGTTVPQSRIAWYPRRAYVADVRPTYVMPAWYAA